MSTRCQWDKQWSSHSLPLPACQITHCVHPFPIPAEAHLEEVTEAWTGVNKSKEYECKGKEGGRHTRFWETDRALSTFQMFCRPDGYFEWKDWPTCLEGEVIILQLIDFFRYSLQEIPTQDSNSHGIYFDL